MTNQSQKRKRKKSFIPIRLNVLFFVVFLLFSILILRLGTVQIVEGEEFSRALEKTSNTTARIDAPRGIMYDRYGHIVVDNELELSVTYTNPSGTAQAEELMKIAENLEQMIDIEVDQIPDPDKRDFVLMHMTRDERLELVSEEERGNLGSPTEEYELEIDRIPQA